jgi:uncharacterized protein (DUF1800 family)
MVIVTERHIGERFAPVSPARVETEEHQKQPNHYGPDVRGNSRRGLLASLAAIGLTAAGCGTAAGAVGGMPAAAPRSSGSATTAPRTSAAPSAVAVVPDPGTPAFVSGRDPVVHLLNRAAFGATPALVTQVQAVGIEAWVDAQLNPASIDDSAVDGLLARFPYLTQSNKQLHDLGGNGDYYSTYGLAHAAIVRMTWSNRQLLERMVDFWQAHTFNKGYPNDQLWMDSFADDREAIRPYALGRFADLLLAETTSPAMMRRLNADTSTKATLNENLGRELLELHTVGVDAGYGQDGVVSSARILTGMSIDPATYTYVFNPADHYIGPVQVLDFSSPNDSASGGEAVLEAYLDHLAHHPATAAHLSRRLALYFVSDNPPDSLVTRLAQTYLANDTAIAPVLKTLFTSPEFNAAIGLRARRPLEDVIATLRILDIGPPTSSTTTPFINLYNMADKMGMAPLSWLEPDGFPIATGRWASSSVTIGRWDMHYYVITGAWLDGLAIPAVTGLLGGAKPATAGDAIDVLANRLVFQSLAPEHRAAVLAFLGADASKPGTDAYLVQQIALLLLDSPYHLFG